jgi:hypothetical protein
MNAVLMDVFIKSLSTENLPQQDPLAKIMMYTAYAGYALFFLLVYLCAYESYSPTLEYLSYAAVVFGLILHVIVVLKKGNITQQNNDEESYKRLVASMTTGLLNRIAVENKKY